MRRRTRPRVVWLPPDGSNRTVNGGIISAPDETGLGSTSLVLQGDFPRGAFVGAAIALVGDNSNAENYIIGQGQQPMTLSDLFNSGYRLRRVCGQIFTCISQTSDANAGYSGSLLATAAFQVMRVDGAGIPVDATAAGPDIYANAENPWIWRRTWALTNFASATGTVFPLGLSNNSAGSVREGAFCDQKTARIVGPDERLFLCLQVTVLADQIAIDTAVPFHWNLRVLASLKTNLGNRRNASR